LLEKFDRACAWSRRDGGKTQAANRPCGRDERRTSRRQASARRESLKLQEGKYEVSLRGKLCLLEGATLLSKGGCKGKG